MHGYGTMIWKNGSSNLAEAKGVRAKQARVVKACQDAEIYTGEWVVPSSASSQSESCTERTLTSIL